MEKSESLFRGLGLTHAQNASHSVFFFAEYRQLAISFQLCNCDFQELSLAGFL